MQGTGGNGKAFSTHDARIHQQRARSTPAGWSNLPNYALTATSLLIALVACSLTLLPMILYLHRFPVMAPFSMFANDAFYYLDVARNSQAAPFFTFDGTHPTNGFHPVWQSLLYLAVKYRWLDLAHPAQAIAQLFNFNLAILSAATFGLALAAARFLKHPWLALLTVCPGWMWFLVAVSAPGYLANWSFLNGMETSIEIFFLACALLCYWPANRLQLWLPAMCFFLGMMVLSRLDDVFFLFPLLGFLVFSAPRRSRRIAIVSSSLPFLMIGLYLLYNLHSVGRAMPISGATKAGHALKDNLRLAYNVFAPVAWTLPVERRASATPSSPRDTCASSRCSFPCWCPRSISPAARSRTGPSSTGFV